MFSKVCGMKEYVNKWINDWRESYSYWCRNFFFVLFLSGGSKEGFFIFLVVLEKWLFGYVINFFSFCV